MATAASANALKSDPPRQPGGSAQLSGLGNRFVELFGQKLSREAFAAQIAALISDTVRLRAAVILGYDRRRDSLTVLAEQGLTDEARAALGAGGDCTWDIPLRGLRNRRISVIEAAHQNPFVPRSLIDLSPRGLCIAALPVYYDFEPTGVVLLFAASPRAFPDGVLQTLAQAIRVCARGLRDTEGSLRRAAAARGLDEVGIAESLDDEAAADARTGREAQEAQLRLVQAEARHAEILALADDSNERIRVLEQQLADAREEVERVTQALRTLTVSANSVSRERDGLFQQLADAERVRDVEGTDLRAQVAALEERLLATDSDRARHQRVAESRGTVAQQAISRLEGERTALLERVRAAESRATEAEAALTTLRDERERLATQVDALSGQMRTAQEALARAQTRYAEERGALEGDRAAWKDETFTVRAELAQRTETLQSLERDLRAALVARDATASQLEGARQELSRLATLTEELERSATQLDATRASAAAENDTLRRTLEDERTNAHQAAATQGAALAAAQTRGEQLSSELAGLRAELAGRVQQIAERDAELLRQRQEIETARHGQETWQQASAALRSDVGALSAQVEQGSAERQQLVEERNSLRAALAEARHAASQSGVAHAAQLGQLQAEAEELRRQNQALTAERTSWAERYERVVEEGRSTTHTAAAAQQRVHELSALLQQRDTSLQTATTAREELTAQLATLAGQQRAGQEALDRAQARYALERAALEADREGWKEQAAAARAELARRTESLAAREYDLQSTVVARDALASDLQAQRAELDRLSALIDELRHAANQSEAARASAGADATTLRRTLEDERAGRVEAEQVLRTNLAAVQTQAEQLSTTVALLRGEGAERSRALAERDQRLAALRSEIENLRQHSADRGVLAQQASELGSKVVELEQLLAAARGETARADRQRATLAEQLDATRRRESDIAAAANQEQAALRQTIEELTAARGRLVTERAAQSGEIDGLRTSLAALQVGIEELRRERSQAEEQAQDAMRRLDTAQGRLEDLEAASRAREAALASTADAREHLVAQLNAALEEAQSSRDALESAQTRHTQMHAALEADRDAWHQQAQAARSERDQVSIIVRDVERRLEELDTAHRVAVTECATLQHALEAQRTGARETTRTLEADLSAARAEVSRLATEVTLLSDQRAAHAAQIGDLQQLEQAARQEATESEQTAMLLRSEVAALTARFEEGVAESQQVRDGRDALERQLALVAATRGKEEQALVQGLSAAREQVAQLEGERRTLRASLAEARKEFKQAAGAHAAAIKETKGEAADLRKQVKTLTAERAKLTERLERSEQARAAQAASAQDDGHRAALLADRSAQLEEAFATSEARRAQLERALADARREAATLTTHLAERDSESQLLRDQQAAADRQLATLNAERDGAQQHAAREAQVARDYAAQLEQERAAAQTALRELQDHADRLTAALQEARGGATELRQQADSFIAERAMLTEQLAQTERARVAATDALQERDRQAATLTERATQLEDLRQVAEARRAQMDADLVRARNEIEALRQQSADRGVLAHQATELGSKVVELEQQLAGAHGEVARAERERASLAQELEVARRQHADAASAADNDQAALRDAVQRLAEERDRLDAERVAQSGQMEVQRATLVELQATLEQARTERGRAEEEGQGVAQRLADAHRRLEEMSAVLQQRDAGLAAVTAERQRLVSQVGKLTGQLRAGQETLESTQGRYALERAAIEADRDAWKEKTTAALAELDRLTSATDEMHRTAAQLEALRTAATTDSATYRRALEDERAARAQTEQAMHAELAARQVELDRFVSDTTALQGALQERDERVGALREERDAAVQAAADLHQTAAALRAELETLTPRLEEGAAECRALRDQRETIERQMALLLATRGEEAEALTVGLDTSRQQIAQLEQERAALRDALADVQQRTITSEAAHSAAADTLRSQLDTLAAERTTFTERLQRMEEAQIANAGFREEETRRAAALADQCHQLERSMAAAQARSAALEDELGKARGEIEVLRLRTHDQGALARQANELGAKAVILEKQLAAARDEGVLAERQRAELALQLETIQAQQTETERERTTLQASLHRLNEERDRVEVEVAAHQKMLTDLRAALQRSEAERQRADQERESLEQQVSEAQNAAQSAAEQLRQREETLAAAVAERQRFEGAVRAAEAAAGALAVERDQLRRKIQETTKANQERVNQIEAMKASTEAARLDSDRRRPLFSDAASQTAEEDSAPPPDGRLVIERSAPLGSVIEDAAESVETSVAEPALATIPRLQASTGELILLDDGKMRADACTALQSAGFEVTAFSPTEAGVDEVARRKVKCVMLNLAGGPGAWRTLRVLRERAGTRSVPVLAYLMKPETPTGFCFGRADFALWPMESGRVIERLGQLRPKLRRLLVLSADVDGMGQLREALAQANISTSIVLDGKQALEFATMVEPEAAILHLSPACPSVSRAMLGLRAADLTRDLPLLILIDRTSVPREDAFFTTATLQLLGKTPFQFSNLPDEIARLIG